MQVLSFFSMDNKYVAGLFLWEVLHFKTALPSMLPMFDNEEVEEDEINCMNNEWCIIFQWT